MATALFSPSWYRVAKLNPRLRKHIEIHRHDYRGRIWHVLQDHANGRAHRLSPAAYHLLGLMDGRGFFDEVFDGVGSFVFTIVILPPILLYFLYHPVLETAMKGRTPGKRAAGIRIVTVEGQTPDISALLIRNVFRLIDSLPLFYVVGLVCVLLSARQVRIGDMAAGTLLAYEKKLASSAFERFAAPGEGALDLSAMEVAQDLLARWNTLSPDRRSQIAAKLISGQGETLPVNVSKRAFDREMHKRLANLAHAPST